MSLAGRFLVYVPGASSTGISRKLPDTERQRLKEILREVVPSDAGVIIRTASEGVKEDDIRADVARLRERWEQIEAKAQETKEKAAGAAVALYEEPDVLVKVIRDLFNEDFVGLIVSGDEAWNTINEYVNSVAPELVSKLTKYESADGPDGQSAPDVFTVHRIDEQLAKAMDRKVWLPSGGTLVIDRTEAMTVIDVNTGKFTGAGGDLEQTVTKNNLEAAEEIVRQLRLRDIGGIVVIDFIDMVLKSNRDLVLRRLTESLARDRTRHQVSEVTSLGLVQLTRKRLGTGLIEAFSTSCPNCSGRGILLHADPVDSAAATGRKSEPGARRGKRSKKSRSESPVIGAWSPRSPCTLPVSIPCSRRWQRACPRWLVAVTRNPGSPLPNSPSRPAINRPLTSTTPPKRTSRTPRTPTKTRTSSTPTRTSRTSTTRTSTRISTLKTPIPTTKTPTKTPPMPTSTRRMQPAWTVPRAKSTSPVSRSWPLPVHVGALRAGRPAHQSA